MFKNGIAGREENQSEENVTTAERHRKMQWYWLWGQRTGPWAKEYGQDLAARKGKETDHPPEVPERNIALLTLDFKTSVELLTHRTER